MISKALVVGGGVGGMSAALSLARRGIEVRLVEIDPHWRAYGAGISVTGLSLRAFDDLGILDEVRERGFVGSGFRMRSVDGSLISEVEPPPNPQPIQSGGGIMRPVLHEILSRKVRESGVTVSLGVEPVQFADGPDATSVTFSDGQAGEFELVVAADGIYSKIRKTLFSDAPMPQFTGQGCWRIVADRPPEVDRTEMYVGGPVKLGLNAVSCDKLYAFILEHVPDNPRFAEGEMLARVAQLLEPFGGHIAKIRASLGPDSLVNYRPLEWMLLPRPWHRGRVVLIGDAAHATTPHMASGAGLAAEDGLVLGEEIARTDDVEQALDAFGERRFERARLVVENSVRVGEIEMAGGNQMDAARMLGDTMHKLHQPY
jgi:2-polyprenyl-6-methoxyphenol hydroxylase-like FAD-dependent oxidoreductase